MQQDSQVQAPGANQLLQILNHIPQIVIWVDVVNHIFLGCNNHAANFFGVSDPKDIIGKTGFDFFSKDLVEKYREDAKIVAQSGKTISKEYDISSTKTRFNCLELKTSPIYNDQGEIESVLTFGIPTILLSERPWPEAVKLINKKNIPDILQSPKYPIHDSILGLIKISRREAECCLYLLKGLTSKEIAKNMDLSPKTIENYIENIKNKLSCSTKSELITKLFDSNFLHNF